MNSHYAQLSLVILMLDAQGGRKITLLTQIGKKLTLSHHQLDINKLLINLHVINNSMSCIGLIFCTNQSAISNYGVDVWNNGTGRLKIVLLMKRLTSLMKHY